MNIKSVRPKRDWALVLHEQRKEVRKSGLIIPVETGAEKVSEGTGIVIRLGNGDKARKLELNEGDRIVFRTYLQYANPVDTDETWEDGTKKSYFLMSIDDIVMVTDSDTDVGVFSER